MFLDMIQFAAFHHRQEKYCVRLYFLFTVPTVKKIIAATDSCAAMAHVYKVADSAMDTTTAKTTLMKKWRMETQHTRRVLLAVSTGIINKTLIINFVFYLQTRCQNADCCVRKSMIAVMGSCAKCVVPNWYCDGNNQCGDGSDEIQTYGNETRINGIACRQFWNTCVLSESQASKTQLLCTKDITCHDGFMCGSGQCRQLFIFCDGDKHCRDNYDELTQLSNERNILCSSSNSDHKCSLPDYHICDQTQHCSEGVDECLCPYSGSRVFLDVKCFRCLKNKEIVIPLARLCDGVFDCPDLTDECLCTGKQRPELCDKVQWGGHTISVSCTLNDSIQTIDTTQICDAKHDCDSKIDETYCGGDSGTNAKEPETNGKGEVSYLYCEQLKKNVTVCNGICECRGRLYEEECSSCTDERPEFCNLLDPVIAFIYKCPSSPHRLYADEVCDGTPRCTNKVDERGCADWFYCKNETENIFRIKWSKVCDKVEDCTDGSDEGNHHNCDYFTCGDNGDMKYVDNRQLCDGTQDCAKGSDECLARCIRSVFSDTKSMIKNVGVKVFVWLISLSAVVGNVAVIVATVKHVFFKARSDTQVNKGSAVNKVLILNLSVSDLIVGIHTFAIVIQNSNFAGRYCLVDQDWRSSPTCSAVGSLLVIGSQESVFTMTIITFFRVHSVTNTIKFEPKRWKFRIALITSWVVSVSLAVIPLIPYLEDYFVDSVWYNNTELFTTIRHQRVGNLTNWLMLMQKNSSETDFIGNGGSWTTLQMLISKLNPNFTVTRKFGFYSTHTVCLPTFFPNLKTETAWWYSLLIISINFLSFVFVFIGSVIIYRSATKRTSATTDAMLKERSSAMQRKLSRIVITDFCCWMPVCIMGFIQLSGVDIPSQAYLPIALIVIPINSSLNPFLYSNVPDKMWSKAKELYDRFKRDHLHFRDASENLAENQADRVIELRSI